MKIRLLCGGIFEMESFNVCFCIVDLKNYVEIKNKIKKYYKPID